MVTSPSRPRTKRNIRALLAVGFALALAASIAGAIIVAMGFAPATDVTQPQAQTGQYVLLLGVAHLVVYVCIFWQVRKLISRTF